MEMWGADGNITFADNVNVRRPILFTGALCMDFFRLPSDALEAVTVYDSAGLSLQRD